MRAGTYPALAALRKAQQQAAEAAERQAAASPNRDRDNDRDVNDDDAAAADPNTMGLRCYSRPVLHLAAAAASPRDGALSPGRAGARGAGGGAAESAESEPVPAARLRKRTWQSPSLPYRWEDRPGGEAGECWCRCGGQERGG